MRILKVTPKEGVVGMDTKTTKNGKVRRISEEEYAAYINSLKEKECGGVENLQKEAETGDETGD